MKKSSATKGNLGIHALDWFRAPASAAFAKSKRFSEPAKISDLAAMAQDIVSVGNQTGEGWFLTGEMLELIHSGTTNIVCAQPFGCSQIILSEKVSSKSCDTAIRLQILLPSTMIQAQVKSTS
mgnify:CR=1 FL=1